MEHYDVIIIGTGAGGGTLAHKLAPSGKKILLLERGGYLPREPENWDSREVFRRSATSTTSCGSTRTGPRISPTSSTSSAATRSSTGRFCFRLRDATSRRSATTVTLAGWPISYADLEPYYAAAERLYLVHGGAGRIRPSRLDQARSPIRPSRTSSGSSSSPMTSNAPVTIRSTCRSGSI